MKITYLCNKCNKEHIAGSFSYRNNTKCECGGVIISKKGTVIAKFDFSDEENKVPDYCRYSEESEWNEHYCTNDCATCGYAKEEEDGKRE